MTPRICEPTHRYDIDGKKVFVFDDVLSKRDAQTLHRSITALPFARERSDRQDTTFNQFWSTAFKLSDTRRTIYYDVVLKCVQSCFPEHQWKLSRAYVNSNSYGDLLLPHRDDASEHASALLYVCDAWQMEWGGETVFYNDKNDAANCVSPRPARLLVFSSNLIHRGNAPVRNCYKARLVFNFRFAPKARRQV